MKSALVPHGRSVAETLQAARKGQETCLHVLYLKGPDELDPEGLEIPDTKDHPCIFLLPEGVKETILAKYPQLEPRILFRDFDQSKKKLAAIIQEARKGLPRKSDAPLSVSVVAPFFFLKRDGITPEAPSPDQAFKGLNLFANNYTIQGVKIKECKAVLNRVYRHLSHQDPARLDACPFLAKQNDIYVVDLSFIPEKYRLDVKHAEKILNQCLREWLVTVENRAPEA